MEEKNLETNVNESDVAEKKHRREYHGLKAEKIEFLPYGSYDPANDPFQFEHMTDDQLEEKLEEDFPGITEKLKKES